MPGVPGFLTRVRVYPEFRGTLPIHPDTPEVLVDLVEQHAPLMRHPKLDGHLAAEDMVRWSYELPELTPEARTRPWTERARDLVRDGWAKVRGIFKAVAEPEQSPAPTLDEPTQLEDAVWDQLDEIVRQSAQDRAKEFEQFKAPKPPTIPETPNFDIPERDLKGPGRRGH